MSVVMPQNRIRKKNNIYLIFSKAFENEKANSTSLNELLEQEKQRNDDLLMKLQEKEKYIIRFEGISSTLQDKEKNFRKLFD